MMDTSFEQDRLAEPAEQTDGLPLVHRLRRLRLRMARLLIAQPMLPASSASCVPSVSMQRNHEGTHTSIDAIVCLRLAMKFEDV